MVRVVFSVLNQLKNEMGVSAIKPIGEKFKGIVQTISTPITLAYTLPFIPNLLNVEKLFAWHAMSSFAANFTEV